MPFARAAVAHVGVAAAVLLLTGCVYADPLPAPSASTPFVPSHSPLPRRSVTLTGVLYLPQGDFEEILDGGACQGGGDGWQGDRADRRMDMLRDEPPVTVVSQDGRLAARGTLNIGRLVEATCRMRFRLRVDVRRPGPYVLTIGQACAACGYPTTISQTYPTADALLLPVVVPLAWDPF